VWKSFNLAEILLNDLVPKKKFPRYYYYYYYNSLYKMDVRRSSEGRLAADLAELKRGVAALANNSRPHKQLVQKGTYLHTTGNILSQLGEVRQHASFLEELEYAVSSTVRTQPSQPSWQDNEPALERSQQEITVKLFVKADACTVAEMIHAVVSAVLRQLRTNAVENLIFAAPVDISEESLVGLWSVVEKMHQAGIVSNVGLSNVSLEGLRSVVAQAVVKPTMLQVRPRLVTADIIQFSRENGIQVLVDSDIDSSLSNDTNSFGGGFHRVLVPPFSSTTFSPLAAARYTVTVPSRAVVVERGYAIQTKYSIA